MTDTSRLNDAWGPDGDPDDYSDLDGYDDQDPNPWDEADNLEERLRDDDPFSEENIRHAAEYQDHIDHLAEKHDGGECDCPLPIRWHLAFWLTGIQQWFRALPLKLRWRKRDDEPPF